MKKSGTSNSRQVLKTQDSSLSSSSHDVTSSKSPLESVTQSSNNVTSSLNYSTNPQSSSQLFYNSLSPEEDTSTRSKAKKRGNNKEQDELKLPRHNDTVRKNPDVITKTYVKSRKKKRRKYTSPIHSNKQHRHHNRRHHRKVKLQRRASAVSNESNSKEKDLTKHRRSLQLSPRYPLLRGDSERALLRFKRKALVEDNGEASTQNHKRKRKKRRQALNRHAKQRSIPVPNLLNVPVSGLRTGYPQGLVGRQTSLTRNLKGFITNRNAISRAKYEQLINRGQTPSLLLNPYMVSSNGYGWRKSVSYMNKPSPSPILPSGNFAKSGNQFAKKGQVQLSPFSPETNKLEIKPATLTRLQNSASTERTQIQEPAKLQHPSEQLQKINQLSRKQFIPGAQRSFYGYVPQLNYQAHFIKSQLPFARDNSVVTHYLQPGLATPHTFPRVSTWTHDWPSVLPETNSHVNTEGDVSRRSRGPQGLIIYLNFEDVSHGKVPYASFEGDLAGASKRTEISRSFGSCGKIARINNGSEILLKGGQIKVVQSDFSPKAAPKFNKTKF